MGDLSPLSPLGLVHASNELRALAPLPLDTPLQVTVWFGETEWRARGVRFDVHTSITTLARPDEALWVGRTSVFKAMSPDKEALKARSKEPREAHVSLKEQAEAREGCDDLQQLHLTLPADLGRQYAPIANDHNPIHLYGWSARLFGFKSAIMHGMWSVGRALALGSPNPSEVSVGEHRVVFKRPLPLPSAPSITLLNTEQEQRFEVYTEDGRLSIEGGWREG
jgi:acyl dehydratase